jgi:sugar fermentation stimulation protein A
MGDLIAAHFLERVNRFLCTVLLLDEVIDVHLHDPGRLTELLIPETKVLLRPEKNPSRKTPYDLVGIYTEGTLVCCDTRIPNRLVKKALQEKTISNLPDYQKIVPEYTYKHSRIDFCLDERILIEVKGVSLVKNGLALFPDAPTERGRKHVETLITALEEGFQSYLLFIIQRPDAYQFSPNAETDLHFAETVKRAIKKGVIPLVYTSEFAGKYIYLRDRILY